MFAEPSPSEDAFKTLTILFLVLYGGILTSFILCKCYCYTYKNLYSTITLLLLTTTASCVLEYNLYYMDYIQFNVFYDLLHASEIILMSHAIIAILAEPKTPVRNWYIDFNYASAFERLWSWVPAGLLGYYLTHLRVDFLKKQIVSLIILGVPGALYVEAKFRSWIEIMLFLCGISLHVLAINEARFEDYELCEFFAGAAKLLYLVALTITSTRMAIYYT